MKTSQTNEALIEGAKEFFDFMLENKLIAEGLNKDEIVKAFAMKQLLKTESIEITDHPQTGKQDTFSPSEFNDIVRGFRK